MKSIYAVIGQRVNYIEAITVDNNVELDYMTLPDTTFETVCMIRDSLWLDVLLSKI